LDIALAYIRLAFVTPFGALGVCAGLLISSIVTHRRLQPTVRDWLWALVANIPNIILIYAFYRNEPDTNQLDLFVFIAVLSGAGGFGLGWVLRLAWLTVRQRKAMQRIKHCISDGGGR
jgi:hypothetical protein